MNTLLYLIVLLPVITGITVYLLPSKWKMPISIGVQIMVFVLSVLVMMEARNEVVEITLGGWSVPIGIMLRMDSISGVLILISNMLFLFFNIYNIYHHYIDKMFIMFFLIMQGLINGVFLVDDLFSVFVLIEVSTIVVSLLIMFKRDSRSMYDGLIYLLINIIAMTFFLFGLAILYKEIGSFSMLYIKQALEQVENIQALYLPYALMMTAVCLKAALMPLFSWLPKAHGTPSAPAVVSAILSGLYVKTGIYLYIRMTDVFYMIDMREFFLVCGLITALVGTLMALSQKDIKLLLSYSTVSQIGLIMFALNIGSESAWWGGIYHMISHAIFKSILFLAVGIVVENYKTRNIEDIKGVFRTMPVVASACIMGVLGITGAPFFSGSVSKYFIAGGIENRVLEGLMMLLNFGTILYFIRFSTIFFGKKKVETEYIPYNRQYVLLILGGICFIGGGLGVQAIQVFYGQHMNINTLGYISKSATYLVMTVIAILIYRRNWLENRLFEVVESVDVGFNTMAMTIPLFFVILLSYMLIGVL